MKRINITFVSLFVVLFLCLPFTLAAQEEVGRDGVYVAYANGIVKDTKTEKGSSLRMTVACDSDMFTSCLDH